MSLSSPVLILDARGNPYAPGRSTGAQIYEGSQDTEQRMSRPWLDADIQRLMSRHKHRMLLSDSRFIASTYAMVGGACDQKADYAGSGGWSPIFTGKDKAWGADARALLADALHVLDARGPLFPFAHDMWLASRALDIDGDFFIAHSRTETGFPQVQFLEAHRVGCRNGERIVESGPYKGLAILNGIIYNASARAVAYRFLADDPKHDADLSARDVTHVAHAKWFSDGRPFPALATAILDWYDVKETRANEKVAQKANSALTLLESNETGTARPGLGEFVPPVAVPGATGTVSTQASTAPKTELLQSGLIRYVKSGSGDLKSHTSNRPSDGWLRFDERIVSGAFYGMGWRVEMFDLSKLSGAPVRGFQDNINTAIHQRWSVLRAAGRTVARRTVAALVDRGDLKAHPEWAAWDFPPPVDFTVDANKDRQTDRENVRAGFSTTPAVARKLGYASAEEMLEEQAEYLFRQAQVARKWSRDGVTITPSQLGTFDKPGDIPVAQRTEAPASATP